MFSRLRRVVKLVRGAVQNYEVDPKSGKITKKKKILSDDDVIIDLNLLDVIMTG